MKDSTQASRMEALITRLEKVALRLEVLAPTLPPSNAGQASATASDVAEIEKIVRTMRLDPDA
jgi:hypothetical protein